MKPTSWARTGAALRLATVALRLSLAFSSACTRHASSPPPFVMLAVFDTTRADHLPMYGAERPTAPALAALAAQGVLFERAFATAPWTVPSHASLFTGRMSGELNVGWQQRNLPADVPVLAEAFAAAGFRTIGISQNEMLGESTGFPRGFESWQSVEVGEARVALESALGERVDDRPVFVFVNLIAAHLPYSPAPAQWREIVRIESRRARQLAGLGWRPLLRMRDEGTLSEADLALLRTLYDGEIRTADAELAEVLAVLRAVRPGDGIVVVTADHGENIGDHGLFDHQLGVPNTLLHVPLVVDAPGRVAPRRVTLPVSLRDLAKTIAVLAELPSRADMPGRDLLAQDVAMEPVVSQYERPGQMLQDLAACCPWVDARRFDRALAAAQDARWKVVVASDGARELFDLSRDPGEASDLLRSGEVPPDAAAALATLEPIALRSLAELGEHGPAAPVSDADRERLRALGYIGDER